MVVFPVLFAFGLILECTNSAFVPVSSFHRTWTISPSQHQVRFRSFCTPLFAIDNHEASNDEDEFGYDETEMDFDMDALRRRISQTDTKNKRPELVYIILFDPDTDNEGAYTLEFPKGSGTNHLLAFESANECDDFANMLKDKQFFDPVPQGVDFEALEASVGDFGVKIQFVPEGTNLLPPEGTADVLDHNPQLKHTKNQLDQLFQQETATANYGAVIGENCGGWE